MTGRFFCERCGEVFKKARSTAEAVAEFKKRHPGHSMDDVAMVCEDCAQEIYADQKRGDRSIYS